MKHKMLLLTLAALLFGWCGAFAQPDTVWVADKRSSKEFIAVSPDERFVVAWGESGWSDELDPDNSWNTFGNPAKVFDAQTGVWLTTIYDTTTKKKNDVYHVSFSPDASKMLVGFTDRMTLIIDLNNNFNVIDTLPYPGYLIYSPDASIIAVNNKRFIDANTYELIRRFTYEINTGMEPPPSVVYSTESQGNFRMNGNEYIFGYEWITDLPQVRRGSGLVILDLADSSVTVERFQIASPFYHRYGTNYYTYIDTMAELIQYTGRYNIKYDVRRMDNDELVWTKTIKNYSPGRLNISNLPQISADSEFIFLNGEIYPINDTASICKIKDYSGLPYHIKLILGNDYIYTGYNLDSKIITTRPCTYISVPTLFKRDKIHSYPVPTNSKLNIEMELLGGDYTTDIFDTRGNKIKTLSLGFKQEGNETIEINTSDLPSGTYMIILRSESDVRSVKFVKR